MDNLDYLVRESRLHCKVVLFIETEYQRFSFIIQVVTRQQPSTSFLILLQPTPQGNLAQVELGRADSERVKQRLHGAERRFHPAAVFVDEGGSVLGQLKTPVTVTHDELARRAGHDDTRVRSPGLRAPVVGCHDARARRNHVAASGLEYIG